MPERIRGEKGVPMYWDEVKERHTVRLTPACWRHLDDVAAANDLPSRAEAIEHLSRIAVRSCIAINYESELVPVSKDAIASLDKIAQEQDISRSELVERYARDPLAFLEWTRSRIETDFEWAVFWDAVEESICYRQGKEPYKLNVLAILKLLKTEDLVVGLAKLEETRSVEKTKLIIF